MIGIMHTKTKIICTIGPAVESLEKMLALIEAGMNVARLNFSHGTYEEHRANIALLKKARAETGKPLALMLDTQGPEIRVGKVKGDALVLQAGQRVKLGKEIPLGHPEVMAILKPGMKVMFDDGYIVAKVVGPDEIEVENNGVLKSGKKMNIPGAVIPIPAMTEKDIEDLKFGCKMDVDLVAASFIRTSHDVLAIKELLASEGKSAILVLAKIESTQGVENFDSIVQAADGIMIARGDLGVEVDLAEVPKLQKMMIRKCFQACKPSITATQMLESMIVNPRPTRAEASDVANAIYDYTSCIMLSGETAVGKYPIEATQRMRSIAKVAEADVNYRHFFDQMTHRDYHDVSSAVAMAAVKSAYSVGAKAIFAFTASGMTARLASRLRPEMPIIAVTSSPMVYHQMALNWGVVPVLLEGCKNSEEAFLAAKNYAVEKGILSFGDVVVVTAGIPFGKKGSTNSMSIENIGDILVRGHKSVGHKVHGKVVFVMSPEGVKQEELRGSVVVIMHCDASFLEVVKFAKGIVLQNYLGDTASEKYVETVAKTYGIAVITRADGAMQALEEGSEVTVDPQRGLIYQGSDN
jgi:pyruvate kinase